MGEARMEGVERRLSESHDRIDIGDTSAARAQTTISDTSGIEVVVTPPIELIKRLDGSLPGAMCDQKMQIVWPSGPWKGMPITGYCAEPLCITEGSCTGPRFVTHIDQWTTTDVNLRSRRIPEPAEMVAASRSFAKKAATQTGRSESRSDSEILAFCKLVTRKTIEHIRGAGQWRSGDG